MPALYVIYPLEKYYPGIDEWIADAWATICSEGAMPDWQIVKIRTNESNNFTPLDVYSSIAETKGPVLILGRIKQAPVTVLRTKLMHVCTMSYRESITDSTDVFESFLEILQLHERGDPQIPKRLAATIQLIRKLQKGNHWGGDAKNKAFLNGEDLPSGRGITQATASIVREVAAELADKGLLKSKRGDGNVKFALNRDRLSTLNAIMSNDWMDLDHPLQKYLLGGRENVSAREIDEAIAGWEADRKELLEMRSDDGKSK
jgi:hypothetical protein